MSISNASKLFSQGNRNLQKQERKNNNHNLTGANGNNNCTNGAIRINNGQVNAKFEKNINKNSGNNPCICNHKSFTARRRITLAIKQFLLTLLLSTKLIQQAKSSTTAITNELSFSNVSSASAIISGIAKKTEDKTESASRLELTATNLVKGTVKMTATPRSALLPSMSLVADTTIITEPLSITNTPTLFFSYKTFPPSIPDPKLTTNIATKEYLNTEAAKELYTMDNGVAIKSDDNIECTTVNLKPPPLSHVLLKGFSIPTFLPPIPAFAMADLPAYNSVPTSPAVITSTMSTHLEQERNLLEFKQNTTAQSSSSLETNITVQMGNHAYLPCKIHRVLNKPISWVRVRDGHILSVDKATFIADQRFQLIIQGEDDFTWSLQIKYVQDSDEGWYECQTSSEPKMSSKVYLGIVVPHTELIGEHNRFVKAGSKVALHCIVRDTLDPPTYIIWFHGKTQITNDNEMGWYTEIDRAIFGDAKSNRNTIGSLIIPFVRKKDSGNYTCQPSNSAPVSVDLHVLSGEYSASAIMSTASSYWLNEKIILILLFAITLFVVEKTTAL